MAWPDTPRIITTMAHAAASFGNGSMGENPRQAGGNPPLSVDPQLSISVVQASASPQPAIIGLRHERPEAGLYFRFIQCAHSTSVAQQT